MENKKVRAYDEYKETTNRYVYNQLRKWKLEQKGEIYCSHCPCNRGENDERKFYGKIGYAKFINQGKKPRFRFPNWKLVSKKEKQWMEGSFQKEISSSTGEFEWVEFKF